jgi:DNA-binding NarL/FixJ family response regulator
MALRCLIVDDSAIFLDGASSLLQREGVDVVGVAASSAEAIRLVDELRPDVTLVDVDLGDESGFDLAQELSSDGHPQSNVILISTHAEQDLTQLIAVSPVLGFVPKTRLSARAIAEVLERTDDA